MRVQFAHGIACRGGELSSSPRANTTGLSNSASGVSVKAVRISFRRFRSAKQGRQPCPSCVLVQSSRFLPTSPWPAPRASPSSLPYRSSAASHASEGLRKKRAHPLQGAPELRLPSAPFPPDATHSAPQEKPLPMQAAAVQQCHIPNRYSPLKPGSRVLTARKPPVARQYTPSVMNERQISQLTQSGDHTHCVDQLHLGAGGPPVEF